MFMPILEMAFIEVFHP